jgi:hypothetical protein
MQPGAGASAGPARRKEDPPKYGNTGKVKNINPETWEPNYCPKGWLTYLIFHEQSGFRASVFTEGDGEGPTENKKDKNRRLKKQRNADRDAQLESGADDAFITTHKKQESAKIGLSAMHEENNSREATLNALNQKLQALTSQVNQLLITISAVAATNPALVDILTKQYANLNHMIESTNQEISLHTERQVEIPAAVSKYVDLTCRKLPTGNSECSPIKATPKARTKKLRGKNVLKAPADVGEQFFDGDAHVDSVERAHEQEELYQHLDRELDRSTTERETTALNMRLFEQETPTLFHKATQFIPEASTEVSSNSPLQYPQTAQRRRTRRRT